MENTNQTQQTNPNKGAFLKSLIKINHPDWNAAQIEAEFIRQMNTNQNDEQGVCEACSG